MNPDAGVASGSWPICVAKASLKKLKVGAFVCRTVGNKQASLVLPQVVCANMLIEPNRLAQSITLRTRLNISSPSADVAIKCKGPATITAYCVGPTTRRMIKVVCTKPPSSQPQVSGNFQLE